MVVFNFDKVLSRLLRLARWSSLMLIGIVVLLLPGCSSKSSNDQTAQTSHHSNHHAGTTSGQANNGAEPASVNKTPPPGPAPEGMVWVPGGTFWMGCDDCNMPDAEPSHLVKVDGFWMDATPVTNAQFAKFVEATGYKTIAERPLNPKDFPGVPLDKLVSGSSVFTQPLRPVSLDNIFNWWTYVPGANWQHPEGPNSNLRGREDHPVVQIAWDDAVAYSKWAGKRLPTEAEFEFAARGGLDRQAYAWGNELKPNGKWAANIWQGMFPVKNRVEDGYERTSPVKAFAPNGFGLYDMGGNVWQWCSDWYRPDYFEQLAASGVAHNPQGPESSYDPQESNIPKRVQKSGSFLCSDQYCSRYLVGSRGKGAADSGGSNTGFRCVLGQS
ncbi:MAG TPA: formylglycine-generating enzyme family protein [Blastocatellia bacterium]|nr:formylglycine-generating enzyme family protein [Blastocatellia bacterium]